MLRTRREREADPATEDPPARLGSTDGGMHYVKAQQNAQTYFKTALCTRRMTGQCVRGFACTYTHGVEKLRTKRLSVQRDPRYKTHLTVTQSAHGRTYELLCRRERRSQR